MEMIISIIGAGASIVVAILGAIFLNINNMNLQNRKLKEENYVNYIIALITLAADNSNKNYLENYALCRNKILIVASEEVVRAILKYEEESVGKASDKHDLLLTTVFTTIRKDLKIKDKNYPTICLKKA